MKSPIEKPFLSKTDIQRIFHCGFEKANNIFHRAKQVELSNDHIAVFEDKVPITGLNTAFDFTLIFTSSRPLLHSRY